MEEGLAGLLKTISVMALPVVMAVVLHEVAHGYVASLKGDDTARRMGRLTLNPLAHIDWFGTVLLPIMFYALSGFLFAYAKPVPVNFFNLRNPKRDMAIVAAAGPVTNLILACLSALFLKLVAYLSPEAAYEFYASLSGQTTGYPSFFLVPILYMLYFSVILNIILAVINLIPVPPADGGRIVTGILPEPQASRYAAIEPYGLIILVVILFVNPLGIVDWTIRPLIGGILGILL